MKTKSITGCEYINRINQMLASIIFKQILNCMK